MQLSRRIKRLLLAPEEEWLVIAEEPVSVTDLYINYVVPLAAIGPVASIIGMAFVGLPIPSVGVFRVPFGAVLAHSVVTYVLSLLGIYIVARFIDLLAPYFSARKNFQQALKLVVYAATAVWLAGIFAALPAAGFLVLLGLYSIYLLYRGLPIIMKAPSEKALAYAGVTMVAAVIVITVINFISNSFLTLPTIPVPFEEVM